MTLARAEFADSQSGFRLASRPSPQRRTAGSLLVGTEEIMMTAIEAGADGSICGGANMFPALYVKCFEAIENNCRSQAKQIQELIAKIAKEIYSIGPASTSYFRGLKGALAQLGVSGEISPATRAAGHKTMAGIGELLERSRAHGPLRDAPMGFVVALMMSLAEATMEYMVHDPTNAKKHCKVGFDALWRVID